MIIATANQKGGSGKTTTAAAIVSGATLRGRRALAVDLDQQCNLTYCMDGDAGQAGAYDMITGETAGIIQHTEQGDLIAGSPELSTADSILKGNARVYALRSALDAVSGDYDVIVIDCPPSLGTLLINALTASDGVIIPLRAKIIHLQGLYLLADTIDQAKAAYNPDLQILGALFTEYNGRTNAARDVSQAIRDGAAELGIPVFKTEIRQGVALEESQIMRESIFTYAPNSNPAKDYAAFLDELGI